MLLLLLLLLGYIVYPTDIDKRIRQLMDLLQHAYVNRSDPYKLAMVGDKETFRKDLIDAGHPELAEDAHAKMIHLDDAYVFPTNLPDRDKCIKLVKEINELARTELPSFAYGIDFGHHTCALIPTSTAKLLFDVGYGHLEWHGLRVYI
jgi:hypothetical protein